jgi:CxxC-x17-CxxC domain-containing protein
MEFTDKQLVCVKCGSPFVFSADEQVFFQSKHFKNAPKLCRKCRAFRGRSHFKTETQISCFECGAPTVVPFRPKLGKPVLCRVCFDRKQVASTPGEQLQAS